MKPPASAAAPTPGRTLAGGALVGALLFGGLLIGLLAWFPARLALAALPEPLSCGAPSGTLWRGACVGFSHAGTPAGDLAWRLEPAGLWRGRLRGTFGWSARADHVQGRFDAGSRDVLLTDVRGALTVETLRASPLLPPALAARLAPVEGRLLLDVQQVEIDGGAPRAARGVIEARGLAWATRERWPLGGMRATFAGKGLQATLRDTGGPLEFQGRLALDAPPTWTLTGTVRARDPAWEPRLAVFGMPDPAGRRTVSVEGR